MALSYNMVRFFEYRRSYAESNIDPTESEGEEDATMGAPSYVPWLRGERLYFVFYHIGLYLLTHFLGPFIMITVLNVLILNTMRKAKTMRAKLIPNSEDSVSTSCANGNLLRQSVSTTPRKRRSRSKTTQMIVVVTAMFLFCNTLPFVLNIWEATMPHVFGTEEPFLQAVAYLVVDLSNTLVVLNSAFNFLLYVAYCKKYRQLFKWYCLAPIRLLDRDESRFRRHLPLFLANNQSSSFDMAKFINFVNPNGREGKKLKGKTMASAAAVSAAVIPFLAVSECSESEVSYSPKIRSNDHPRFVVSAMVPTNDSFNTRL